MRSKLFVPGARPELFAKALAGDADALSLDLEDAVAVGDKDAARRHVGAFVASEAVRAAAKVVIVRTNAPDTAEFAADVAAVAAGHVALINLPKVESAQALRDAVDLLETVESHAGIDARARLLVTIETPRALAHAAEIARASPRVAGLQLGLADLFEPYGIDRSDPANVHAAMFTMRMAAARADVFALDAAFANLSDPDAFGAEARMARRLGYLGKSCIHPRQVAWANAAFAPSQDELAAARRVVEAARTQPRGAFVVDGRMIDLPFLKRAQAIVANHR